MDFLIYSYHLCYFLKHLHQVTMALLYFGYSLQEFHFLHYPNDVYQDKLECYMK